VEAAVLVGPGATPVEFIQYLDAMRLLAEVGVREFRGDTCPWKRFELADGESVRRLQLSAEANSSEPEANTEHQRVDRVRIPALVEHVLHRLRLHEVLLIPFSPWRAIFDAVAFNLAENKAWQEVDAMASVELNSHDPLQCSCGDFNTLESLMTALLKDADSPAQSITIAALHTPMLIEFSPLGTANLTFGSPAIARELIGELAQRA
jgi:hypothetical protein